MGNIITVFEHSNGQHSCLYGWDTREVELYDISKMKKIYVPDTIVEEIKDCTIDRLESILSKL